MKTDKVYSYKLAVVSGIAAVSVLFLFSSPVKARSAEFSSVGFKENLLNIVRGIGTPAAVNDAINSGAGVKTQEERKADFEAKRQESLQKTQELRTQIQQKRDDFKQKETARREELKKQLGEQRAANIERFFQRMSANFESAADRLGGLADRLETYLSRLADEGKDISVLQDNLEQARVKVAVAKQSLENSKNDYAKAVESDDFKTAFQNVRSSVEGVKIKMREARQALVDVISSIKGVSGR